MTDKLEIYKCNICGNVVQVLKNGSGELVCCGENMKKLSPQYEENGELAEKHIPEIEDIDEKTIISLKNHPMSEEHHIEFIEIYTKDKKEITLKYFEPNETPIFETQKRDDIVALELCNIHGLWRSKND